jgi:hypothetical protein
MRLRHQFFDLRTFSIRRRQHFADSDLNVCTKGKLLFADAVASPTRIANKNDPCDLALLQLRAGEGYGAFAQHRA